MSETANGRFSSVDPAAHLPRLSNVFNLPADERHAALAQWVAWFNAHRDRVEPALEHELDRALTALDHQVLPRDEIKAIQERFDHWLASAGRVGEGRGPGEDESPPLDG